MRMPQQLSPFDLLPDEVLGRILTEVGRRRGGDEYSCEYHVQDFLLASCVCKRWSTLCFQVKDVDWSFDTLVEALSLVNFVQDDRVSLSRLGLHAQLVRLPTIQLPLLFNALFKSRCPARMDVILVDGIDTMQAASDEASDLGGLLNLLLECRKLEELTIDGRGLCFDGIARISTDVSQALNIRTLSLVKVEVTALCLRKLWNWLFERVQ
ncbi:hypothetical protein KFL_004200030 [Klebsormidium nitens]|uniref:F-box domain-containing protein n=1 Tax=Klebsormidium nitens TaxID=105231 RepID=A0A1Y1II71_KLENI|nr:hypothetical protein KFL_004200030 [Klebsormidium nitens]|eukprot:GAQ88347.1 hypothetical protein KFL_004200030 [Klebsormidium nitens]